MLKQSIRLVCLFTVCLGVAGQARADDIAVAAQELCEKVKSCAMAQIAQEDLTPELRQMMQPMLDNMCANMQEKIGEVPVGHSLYEPAVDCMRSMQSLSCEMMQDPQLVKTRECEAYEKMAQPGADEP